MYFFLARVYRALRAVMKHLTWWLFITTQESISVSVFAMVCVRVHISVLFSRSHAVSRA